MSNSTIPNLHFEGYTGLNAILRYSGRAVFEKSGDCNLMNIHTEAYDEHIIVEGKFEARTTDQSYYYTTAVIAKDGCLISCDCWCPQGKGCQHCCKVLDLAISVDVSTIPENFCSANKGQEELVQNEELHIGLSTKLNFVFIASSCRSEQKVDFWAPPPKEFDHQILGVFFNLNGANMCAKNYTAQLTYYKDEETKEKLDFDDDDTLYNWFEENIEDEDHENELFCHRVWVEMQPVEDSASRFA